MKYYIQYNNCRVKMGCNNSFNTKKQQDIDMGQYDKSEIVRQKLYQKGLSNPYASGLAQNSFARKYRNKNKSPTLSPTTQKHNNIQPQKITVRILGHTIILLDIQSQTQKTLKQLRLEMTLGNNYNFCHKNDTKKPINIKDQSKTQIIDIINKNKDTNQFYINVKPQLIKNKNGKYQGQTQGKNKQGFGIFYFNNRNVYEGMWAKDQMHGQGKLTLPNGEYYEGEWKYGKKHGKGKYRFKNGNIYIGDYQYGVKNGPGILKTKNGQKYAEVYSNGKRIDRSFIPQ